MMGDSLAQYRAKIGCFEQPNKSRTTFHGITIGRSKLSVSLRLLVLFSLLLIASGDVESHRGPRPQRTLTVNESGTVGINSGKGKEDPFSDITAMLRDIQNEVRETNSKFDTLNVKVDKMAADLHVQLENIMEENRQLRASLSHLEATLEDLECRNRRDNLVFRGLEGAKGETWDKSEEIVRDFLANDLDMAKADEITILRAHRLNPRRESSPIVAKFLFPKEKSEIYKRSRSVLPKDSGKKVSEDFPQKIREDRRALSELFSRALKDGKKPKMRVNKLIIDKDVFRFDREKNKAVKISDTASEDWPGYSSGDSREATLNAETRKK